MASSQDLGSFEEVTAANYHAIGARQVAMGGVGIPLSHDGASLYHNPAGLARLSTIEFQFSLSNQQFDNISSQPPERLSGFNSVLNRSQADLSRTRFSSAILTVPVPTYRGSLVVSAGITKVMSFSRAALLHVIDINGAGDIVDDFSSEVEEGAIYAYTGGAAIDLSPHLSVGASFSVLSGDDRFRFENRYSDETNSYVEGGVGFINESYIGITAKVGLLLRPNASIAWGFTVESPVRLAVEYSYEEDSYQTDTTDGIIYDYFDSDYLEYNLIHPPKFGTGISFRHSTLTLATEIEYTDWSKMEYQNNFDLETDNDSLALLYREVLNWRAGIEYQYPRWGLAVRGGFFSQPLPYHKANIKDDRFGYSFGVGWLTGGHLMLEAAYSKGRSNRIYTALNGIRTLAEDDDKRIYLTISYR